MKKIITIISIILAILIASGAGIGYAIYQAKNDDSSGDDVQIKNEHPDIVEDVDFIVYDINGQALPRISQAQFDVGSIQKYKVSKAYSLDIIPNTTITTNINFKLDGTIKSLRQETSLIKGFKVVQSEDNSITIDLFGTNLLTVLEGIYGTTVELSESDLLNQDKIFTIVIRAIGSNDVRYIDFGLNTLLVNLSPNDVIIG